MFLKVLIFSCLFLAGVKCHCPHSSGESWNKKCYYFIENNETNFASAETYCNGLGGNLASVHDAFVGALLTTGDVTTEYWLGGSNANGSWSWTDGTTFDFSEWKRGEPKNDTEVRCIVLSVNNGLWSAQNCSKEKQFICSTPEYIPTVIPTTPSPYKCPDGANFFDLTGYCYLDFFPAEAEKDCFSIGGNYASIHSTDENEFIGSFYKPVPPYYVIQNVFIGLKRTNYTSAWKWTDGTPVDYKNFANPNNEGNCVILNSNMNAWYPEDCEKKYTAICKVRATPV